MREKQGDKIILLTSLLFYKQAKKIPMKTKLNTNREAKLGS